MNHHYGKQQCLDMDWNNTKEINTKNLAWCINKYKLDAELIPEQRLKSIMKKLAKLENQHNADMERKVIEAELSTGNDDYYLEPDLFQTSYEALMAMNELHRYWSLINTKQIEQDYKHKNNNYSRDLVRMEDATRKLRQQYLELGGIAELFDKCISTLPTPTPPTLNQDVNSSRERITEDFVSLGISPTRAKAIAIAITTEAYQALK